MTNDHAEQVALHRWAVIAEATNPRLTPAERGAVVRRTRRATHAHPDGTERRYSRDTIDRWIREWRAGGLEALRPRCAPMPARSGALPELFAEAAALRLELPSRSAAAIADDHLATATGCGSPSAPCGPSCAGVVCTVKHWRPSRRRSDVMRRNARTSAGSPTCSSGRGCRTLGSRRVAASQALPDRRRPQPSAGPRTVHDRTRTPGPARTCCAARSCAGVCPTCSTSITAHRSPTTCWPGPAPCSASGWCTPSPTRLKAVESRND